ncbi:zonadhesin-like [Cydia amplana]|uniref:zonadhesin-like n=1 Tax=Cydia amplana TaxID=1869771 RepID=UPI002FE50A83
MTRNQSFWNRPTSPAMTVRDPTCHGRLDGPWFGTQPVPIPSHCPISMALAGSTANSAEVLKRRKGNCIGNCIGNWIGNCIGNCIGISNKARTDDGSQLRRRYDFSEHPPKCGKNEVYDDCSSPSCKPTHCSELGYPLNCDKKCKPGCKCKDGYVRNDKGVCIPIKTCKSCGGDKNAVSGCGTNCGKTCASIGQKPPVVCPLICKLNGCDCRDRFFYDPNQKKCVKKEDCSKCYRQVMILLFFLAPTCKDNEVYSPCANGGCGPKNCSQINDPKICIDPICVKGCVCKDGYLRNDVTGKCVPKDECPKKCPGQNEYYEPCIHNCGSQNCSDKGKIYHCPIIKPGKCDSCGCRCKPGYLRNAKGLCIPEKDCPPPKCRSGEVFDSCPTVPCEGDNCPKTKDSPQSCPTGIVCSPPRCVCGYNRKRAKNGTCILIRDCPPFKCGKNEMYVACPSNCPGEKCSDYINQTKCPPYKIGIIVNCKPACKCKKGYYRDKKGNCILACDCKYSNVIMSSDYHNDAEAHCSPMRLPEVATVRQHTLPGTRMWKLLLLFACVAGSAIVFCDGLTLASKCGLNQVFSNCTNGGCEARNCSQAGKPVPCVKLDPKSCKKGCVCATGYLRASNGTCVLRNQCNEDKLGTFNKYKVKLNLMKEAQPIFFKARPVAFALRDKIDKELDRLVSVGILKPVEHSLYASPIVPVLKRDGSLRLCADYSVSINKQLIVEQYPLPTAHELFARLHGGQQFSKLDLSQAYAQCVLDDESQKVTCINTHRGVDANKLRYPSNQSLDEIEEPSVNDSCATNEIESSSSVASGNQEPVSSSPAERGEEDDTSDGSTQVATSGGEAEEFFEASDDNVQSQQVATPADQSSRGGLTGCGDDLNSHPGCGVNCGRTCSTYKNKDVACILVCYDNGCDCNIGYVYDPNVKKCVLPKYCTPTCGLNEVYSTCTNGGCSRRNCSQLGKPQICIDRTPESCTKGCVCAEGYLRNANGTCVLENQCPQLGCGGDRNAKPGCGINCGRRCSDYKVKNKQLLCPRIQCKADKCDCKDGFVFDGNLKKCVLPEQCTPVCGLNEKFDSCINGGCGHRNCSQIGTPQICIDRTPESCIKGCVCSDGFLRAANGTCIPQDQCPASSAPETDDRCPGQNEFYNTCISSCSNQSCDSIGKVIHCPIQPAVCREGCRCKAGYWRNADNVCVPENECGK